MSDVFFNFMKNEAGSNLYDSDRLSASRTRAQEYRTNYL